MAELDKTKVLASDLMTVGDFVKRLGRPGVTNASIAYHYGLDPKHPDNLDVVKIGRDRFIVDNERAKAFTIGNNYWNRREGWSREKVAEKKKQEAKAARDTKKAAQSAKKNAADTLTKNTGIE